MRARRPGWPLAAALALHLAAASALALAPLRRLPPPAEPASVTLVAAPEPEAAPAHDPPAEIPLTGAADLQEAMPSPVVWPQHPAPARSAPAPRQVAAPRHASPAMASSPMAAPGPPVPAPSEITTWQAALSAWVERHRRYPPAARFRQEEGVVRVRFVLDPAGRVQHVALEGPSGSAALDAAALSLLAGATLPAPPPGMDPARRSVSLAIRYRLE